MKRAGLIVVLVLLGGCAPSVSGFNPPAVTPAERVPGNAQHQAFDSSRNMTAAKTTTEEAMARFAASAVSAIALARRSNAIAPVSDR